MDESHKGRGEPQRFGFLERSRTLRVLRVDQEAGMVDINPSELRLREERVVRLDHEAGRVPPRFGSLQGAKRKQITKSEHNKV